MSARHGALQWGSPRPRRLGGAGPIKERSDADRHRSPIEYIWQHLHDVPHTRNQETRKQWNAVYDPPDNQVSVLFCVCLGFVLVGENTYARLSTLMFLFFSLFGVISNNR